MIDPHVELAASLKREQANQLALNEREVIIEQQRRQLAELREQLDEIMQLHPRDDWHEDDGNVLWYRLPIEEPPYCGTPNSSDWPENDSSESTGNLPEYYYTHWQRLPPVPKSATQQGE